MKLLGAVVDDILSKKAYIYSALILTNLHSIRASPKPFS